MTRIPCTRGQGRTESPDSLLVHPGADDCGLVLELEGNRWVYLDTREARELADRVRLIVDLLPRVPA